MMTLRHLYIFKAVTETKNFTKAAQRLYITQSAVSHAVRELEEYAGTPLFDRLSKRVQLTRSGELLLDEILPVLAACESLDGRIKNLEEQAPIHLVSSITIAIHWLPKILADFKRQWPKVTVQVEVVSAANALETLRKGKADFALLEGSVPQGPFSHASFDRYSLQMVCSPQYPCACTSMDMESFCSENLLLRETGSAIRDVLDSTLLLSGHSIRPLWVSVNSPSLIEAAKAGLGIAVLPHILVKNDLEKGSLISLDVKGLSLENELFAVWHKDKYLPAPQKALLSCIIPTDTHDALGEVSIDSL